MRTTALVSASRVALALLIGTIGLEGVQCSPDGRGDGSAGVSSTAEPLTPIGWTQLGPFGVQQGGTNRFSGVATDIEFVSNGHYRVATLGAGIFEWNDTGWIPLSNSVQPVSSPVIPCEGLSANTVATKPDGMSNTIVVGTIDDAHIGPCKASGIWLGSKGTDWTWSQVATAATVGEVYKIRWSDASSVHAATSNGYFMSTTIGTTNVWNKVRDGYFTDLAVHPADSNTIYLAQNQTGLVKATYSGSTPTFTTLTPPTSTPYNGAVAVSAAAPTAVYYMPKNASGAVLGIWKVVAGAPATRIMSSAMQTANLDSGRGWSWALAVHPTNSQIIMAGALGQYATQDGGTTWNATSGSHPDIHALAFDPLGNGLAATDGGYLYSPAGATVGNNWLSDSNTLAMTGLTDFDVQPNGNSATIYGTAWDTGNYVSKNGGSSWAGSSLAGNGDQLFITADPFLSGRAWEVSGGPNGGNGGPEPGGCKFRTTNSGDAWSQLSLPCIGSLGGRIAHDNTNPIKLYIVEFPSSSSTQFFVNVSPDWGDNWTRYRDAIPVPTGTAAVDIAVGPRSSGISTLYAGVPGTTSWLANRNAPSWYNATTPAPVDRIMAHSTDAHRAYAIAYSQPTAVIYETTNDGVSWTPIAGDMPALGVLDIVADPNDANTLFAGTFKGIYKTSNHGTNWKRWTAGLPAQGSQSVERLRIQDTRASGGQLTIYAGLWGSGIWQRNAAEQGTATWSAISGQAFGIGSGWAVGTIAVGNDFKIYQYLPGLGWSDANGGAAVAITTDLNGTPWVVNNAGNVYKWTGAGWMSYGTSQGICFSSVASGATDQETWATRCTTNTVWHWNGSSWVQVGGNWAASKIAVFSNVDPTCGDHLPVLYGTDQKFYFVGHSGCSGYAETGFWPNGGGTDLTTDFAVSSDGYVYRWNPPTGIWTRFISAPFGADTRIGGWKNGIFATSATQHTIQLLSTNPL